MSRYYVNKQRETIQPSFPNNRLSTRPRRKSIIRCDISGRGTTHGDQYSPWNVDDDCRRMVVFYSLKTAQWSGDDSPGDPNGYGHTSGTEDGSTDSDEDDCEIWFDVWQGGVGDDGDGIPYWREINGYSEHLTYHPDPITKDMDSDRDKIPDWWELKYGLDPSNGYDYDNDLDDDGLTNLEEFWSGRPIPDVITQDNFISRQGYTFGGNPNVRDIFVEVDWMTGHEMNDEAQYKVIKAFAEHDIHLWIDDGWMGGGEQYPISIPTLATSTIAGEDNDWNDLYTNYFLNNDPNHPRRYIFRYAIFADKIDTGRTGRASGRMFVISDGVSPVSDGADNQAGIFMHELGHTLGLTGYNGIDNDDTDPNGDSYDPNLYENYKSVMNYHYTFQNLLDYSDGSNGNDIYGNPDFDDWGNLKL